jgi:hypothetical protein
MIENMQVEIYSHTGNRISAQSVEEYQAIDISDLPVGVYNVVIKTEGMTTEYEQLIKMK